MDKQKQWLLNQSKISVHFWQNGVNRADKNNKKGLALERQFRSKDGGQATIPVQSPLVEPINNFLFDNKAYSGVFKRIHILKINH